MINSKMGLDDIKSERRYGIEIVEVPKLIPTDFIECNGRYIPTNFIKVKKYVPIKVVIPKKDVNKLNQSTNEVSGILI